MKLTQQERSRVACMVMKKVIDPYIGEGMTQDVQINIQKDLQEYMEQAKAAGYFTQDTEIKINFSMSGIEINVTGTFDEEEQDDISNSQERQQITQNNWDAFDKLIPEL